MNTEITQIYESLPIIDVKNDFFSSLDQDKSESKIMSLINKDIIFEARDIDGQTFQHVLGELLAYKDDYLSINPYDCIGPDYFKEFEKVHIDKVIGIERYKESNSDLKLKAEFRNSICEITDRDNNTITVLLRDFDSFEIEFQFKYITEDGEHIGAGSYPICLIKEIKIL